MMKTKQGKICTTSFKQYRNPNKRMDVIRRTASAQICNHFKIVNFSL